MSLKWETYIKFTLVLTFIGMVGFFFMVFHDFLDKGKDDNSPD